MPTMYDGIHTYDIVISIDYDIMLAIKVCNLA